MTAPRRVPASVYGFVGLVAIAGVVALVRACSAVAASPFDYGWLALALLTWVSGTFAVKIPATSATISVSEVFVFSLAILYGGPAATVTVAVDGLLTSLYRGNREPRRLLFNIFEPAVSISLASALYGWMSGVPPLSVAPAPLTALVMPVFLLAASYLLLNTWLTASVMALESSRSPFQIWRQHIVWLSVNFLSGASIALLLSVNMRQVSVQGLLLVLPLVFLLYLVFRTWTERVRDAGAHVATIDRLYLSTVEALAIAIESKDQVTSTHVRRVQNLSLAIARHLGVTGDEQMRAIEAGALLHDIGKVAIPDYVLNKPGRLTPDEYDLIKLHAPIGAEILTAVDFPYPVVPIVRSHHENWDGTGYPDGLAGEAIPIGARIISVVDCFDALTSDRPYRRALSDEAALAIIHERSGHMYAPNVVEALVACYQEARAQSPMTVPHAASALIARVNEKAGQVRPASAAPAVLPTAALIEGACEDLWSALDASRATPETRARLGVPAFAALLRTLTPAATVCVCPIESRTQSVTFAHVFGHGEQLLRESQIALGEGISGWVAANRAPMINSDPALDSPERMRTLTPRLCAALSVPIAGWGVLTLYAERAGGFDASHQELATRAAAFLGKLLQPESATSAARAAAASDERRDAESGLLALVQGSNTSGPCGVLSITGRGDAAGAVDVMTLATLVMPAVRLSDGVTVSAHDEVVAILPGCEVDAESVIASRLQEAVDASRGRISELHVGFSISPKREGPAFAESLRQARGQRRTLRPRAESPAPAFAALESPDRRSA
ncbi:MAG: HD domain-containing protein [Vicinamibacterales bacterium]